MKKEYVFRYLAARYAFEPLPHYAMIAVALCGADEPLPDFARSALHWLAWRFIEPDEGPRAGKGKAPDKPPGTFPDIFTDLRDKASDQWRRAKDCALFLTDEKAALEYQLHRLWLIEEFWKERSGGMSILGAWQDMSVRIEADYNERGEKPPFSYSEDALRRRWEALVGQRSGLEAAIPVALTKDGKITLVRPHHRRKGEFVIVIR